MNINYKEPQFELFPANSATLEDINKPKFLLASLTLSIENLVILAVLGIMISLFSFSIGVERGRILAAQTLDEKITAVWNVGGRRLAAASNAPASNVVSVSSRPVFNKVYSNPGIVHPTWGTSRVLAVIPKAMPKAASFKALPAPVASSVSTKWTVQVATYKNANYAQQEAIGIKAKGYPVFIIKSKDFYLVCVGQYGSQSQADSFQRKVQSKFQGSQVRRV